ncbi:hypothetical protein [Cyanobium sp. NIES-981]|uniref:hypothetical protein n=1 Tax=Cyanobium sp. NIES-981 TaxID=1851505 RepID=UPI0007DCE8A5|nr:hypothetical protein [Cyanobium sp. NIES-981]SBO43054.1 conserved protein of unknown function [Cyanobium sp. NIES-981]
MILLNISNSSEVIASKVGKFLESLTPDGLDQATVEDIVVSKLIENLKAEGIKGEVATVKGLELQADDIVMHDAMRVRRRERF